MMKTLDKLIEKLKPNWLSFIIVSIVLASQQIAVLLYSAQYLGLDLLHGDPEQMAIQLFNFMNAGGDQVAKIFKFSQDMGELTIPVFFIGVCLYFLNRESYLRRII